MAHRPRELIGQFLFENILLTAVGGVLGILGAIGVIHLLGESGIIPFASFSLNWRVFVATITIITFFGLLSGGLPRLAHVSLAPGRRPSRKGLAHVPTTLTHSLWEPSSHQRARAR